MAEPAPRRLTADAFIAWAMEQPSGRFELEAGEVVAMAPERAAHAKVKAEAWLALRTAARAAGLPCEAYPDGMAVVVDERTVYEPDALLRCGPPLGPDDVRLADPVVVVEALSPSTRALDLGGKLEAYFRLPALRHYLIVKIETRQVIHHARDEAGGIATRIVSEGALRLDPPGLAFRVEDLFATL